MENAVQSVTIGAFAKAAGVNVARVQFIKSAQRLDFSLDEVAALLRLDDGTHCHEARELAEQKHHRCAR